MCAIKKDFPIIQLHTCFRSCCLHCAELLQNICLALAPPCVQNRPINKYHTKSLQNKAPSDQGIVTSLELNITSRSWNLTGKRKPTCARGCWFSYSSWYFNLNTLTYGDSLQRQKLRSLHVCKDVFWGYRLRLDGFGLELDLDKAKGMQSPHCDSETTLHVCDTKCVLKCVELDRLETNHRSLSNITWIDPISFLARSIE